MAIVHWGDEHLSGAEGRPVRHRHTVCGHVFNPELRCSECGEPVLPQDVVVLPGPGLAEDTPLAPADPARSPPPTAQRH